MAALPREQQPTGVRLPFASHAHKLRWWRSSCSGACPDRSLRCTRVEMPRNVARRPGRDLALTRRRPLRACQSSTLIVNPAARLVGPARVHSGQLLDAWDGEGEVIGREFLMLQ
eukprot:CAMPEP_0206181952 /NCGR_PEP_ID=MMETSP1474-20131121/69131_1 /ASSEMBLY_ACC=CAM_ASM_001110 /TAXON_ID=97495 /ORGANISM="Imantonia sp., Strain RCC918" /LENGTH=113 /DNA_ID=CAMNT_0053596343 /DNA_START=212 /DNA_END=554 /DNA_ORIENTATION=+